MSCEGLLNDKIFAFYYHQQLPFKENLVTLVSLIVHLVKLNFDKTSLFDTLV